MAEIIKSGLRIAFLTLAYETVILTMTGMLPDLILAFTDIEISQHILGALTSAVSIVTFILGPAITRIGLYIWFFIPGIKLIIYFLFKFHSLGEMGSSVVTATRTHVVESSSKSE